MIKSLGELEVVARSGSMWHITSRFYVCLITVMYELSEYQKVVGVIKRYLSRSKLKEDLKSMLFCYKHLG